METKEIKQLAFPTADGTAVFDGTKYVKSVNNLTPYPDTGSVYISNVDSATVLKSYRNINGTPFNGSVDITTQYWGTARNIVISDYLSANAGPETSVNGSSNVVLKLPTTIKANIDGNCTGNSATATNATNANHATSADSATNAYNLGGYPASKYVRSVNGVNADTHGNVQLRNIGAITGEIKWFAFNTPPDGYLVCNGAWVSRTTYADLFAKIGTTFGSGDGSTTFTLPNLIDKFAQGNTTVGTVKSAGLPKITGNIDSVGSDYTGSAGPEGYGAFYSSNKVKTGAAGSTYWYVHLNFDASRSSSIYGNSTTVQPPALTLLPCIKY